MKVLVCGGRDFREQDYVSSFLDGMQDDQPIDLIIHGGAQGADTMAGEWAKSRGIHTAVVAALWDTHGKGAGPIRNKTMLLLNPDWVVAFPGGRGTSSMIAFAKAARVPVIKSWE